ncbi:hypothetical protein NL676_006375 [Syzygium grande]|nr:hypothetical protein NL676_006375 [Syzygium grande]
MTSSRLDTVLFRLCEGSDLHDRLLAKEDGRYTEEDAAVVAQQILQIAAKCHLGGLVHRDMKPRGEKFRDINGGLNYIAPEVLKRQSGPESDAWSIGVVTYVLLCVRLPSRTLLMTVYLSRLPLYLVNHHLQALADTLKGEELPDLMDQFDAVDVDKNDSIGFEEMRRVDFPISDRYNNTMPLPHIYNLLSCWETRKLTKTVSLQALAKDLPWKLKESRVLEILRAENYMTMFFSTIVSIAANLSKRSPCDLHYGFLSSEVLRAHVSSHFIQIDRPATLMD